MTKPNSSSSTLKKPSRKTDSSRRRPATTEKRVKKLSEKAPEVVVSPMSETFPHPSVSTNNETKKMALYTAVSVFMFLVVLGWGWSLRFSLEVPPSSDPAAQELQKTVGEFSTLFQQTVDDAKKLSVPTPTDVSPVANSTAPTLTPQEIESLKQKVLENTTTQHLPSQP